MLKFTLHDQLVSQHMIHLNSIKPGTVVLLACFCFWWYSHCNLEL